MPIRVVTMIPEDTSKKEMNEVLARINNGEIEYLDLHDDVTKKLQGYIIFADESVCPLFTNEAHFCLNPLFVSKSKDVLQLSRFSVGGTVSPGRHDFDIEKAISYFNTKACESPYSNFRLITDYKIF